MLKFQNAAPLFLRILNMRIFLPVSLLLLAGLAASQAKPDPPNLTSQEPAVRAGDDEKQTMPDSASAVSPDAAVLTIKGMCAKQAKTDPDSADAACQVVITRAQFERLTNAIHASGPTQKRQLATSYPRLLAMAREAEQRGLDKQAHFEEKFAFARLQILSQELVQSIRDEAAQVPPNEIEDYYRAHRAAFERGTLERIMVPDIRQTEVSKGNEKADSSVEERSEEKDKEAMRQEAEVLRSQAMTGKDFTKLQKRAYEFAGLSTPPPPTRLVKTRRASLPAAHQPIFDMRSGEVSEVISDAGGFYIYKLVVKEIEPLEEARNEIRKTLENQRMRAMMQKVEESVSTDVNQAYFGPLAGTPRAAAPPVKANESGAAPGQAATPDPQ